jgi:hypothetical protein
VRQVSAQTAILSRQRINDEASGLRNAEVPADLLGEEVGDFGVARHRFNSAIRGVGPE